MPTFTVSIDGTVVSRVRTDEFEVLSIGVGGTRVEDELAHLEMSAGAYREGRERTHLIWINSLPLQPRQRVEVELTEMGETCHRGKTIDELFPDEKADPDTDFKPTAKIFAELRERQPVRNGYSFEVRLPSGEVRHFASTPDEHGFGFTVLWNSYRPERASVSLHTFTIDSVEQRIPGRDHVREYFKPGQSVALNIET